MVPTESLLHKTCYFGITELRSLGIYVPQPEIHVIDNFPPPYDTSPVSALTIGPNADTILKGGLYFLRNDVRPYYSSFLLLHELVHYAVADRDRNIARGLEEGIAEVVGSLYLAYKYMGTSVARRIFTYNRLFEADHTLWDLYLDYTRQAASLYLLTGLNGVANVLQGGRGQIKAVEKAYSLGTLPSSPLIPEWDSELTKLVHSLVLGYVPHMVVSPMAKYLSRFVRANLSVRNIIRSAGVEEHLGERALVELAESARVIALSPDLTLVTHSDCELVQPSLRYSTPG